MALDDLSSPVWFTCFQNF